MKFPFIIFFRHDQYSQVDEFFTKNAENLDCSVYITNNFKKVEKLHNANFHLLITYGDSDAEYNNQRRQNAQSKKYRCHHTPQ